MIEELFEFKRVVGIVASRHQGKTSLALQELINIGETGLDRYVYGVSDDIKPYLRNKGIRVIENKEDVLDLKLNNSIIYIDEISDVFNVSSQSKQRDRFKRFINRLNHLNTWIFFSTAENKFYNSFVEGIVEVYIIKGVDYSMLVNGTELKRKVLGISIYSDYRLECDIEEYYILSTNKTTKHSFEYNINLDSKKDNLNPFAKKNSDVNYEVKSENVGNIEYVD